MADTIKPTENADIRKIYVPSEKDQNARVKVYQRLSDMKETRSQFEPKWDQWEKQYEAWRPPKDKQDWQSNIVPPFTTSIVEAELSELVDQTLRPKITARGSEDKPRATLLNHIYDYSWEVGNGDIELYKIIKESLILGNGIAQLYYWKDARQVRSLVEYDPEQGIEKYEEQEIADFDDVYMEAVKLQDFYIDENARSINAGPFKANDCIRRYIIPFERFKEIYKGPIWDPLNAAQYVKPGGDTNYYEYYKPPTGIGKKDVEVLWYWSRRPDELLIVANDVVMRNNPSPYNHKQLPFAQASDILRPHHFYDKGEPELLESIQEELTTQRRQRTDRIHLDIDKMFLISNREVLTDQDLIAEPHKAIFVDDPFKSIKPLEYSQTPSSAYQEEDRLKEDGERVTGMDVRSQSVKASGSATEAAILKEATLRRLRLKVWLLSRTFLVEAARLQVANILQFYTSAKLRSIVGVKSEELERAIEENRVKTLNGEDFIEDPRTIRTTDIELIRTPANTVEERERKGENFFDIRPEDITPSKGGYDIKLSAEPTFSVSKPLLQQRVNELFQHPIIRAAVQAGFVDLKKSAIKMLEINDFDPEDFEVKKQKGMSPVVDPQKVVALAFQENEDMARGDEIPGTGFAPKEHTDIHLEFIGSADFREAFRAKPTIINNFIRHISFEGDAQDDRAANIPIGVDRRPPEEGQQAPPPGIPVGIPPGGAAASEAQAAQPGRAVGETGATEGIVG